MEFAQLKCSFDEFVGEKVVSPSYFSAILGPTPDTDVLNSVLDSVGEGKGGMIWDNGIETCKFSCLILL